MGRAGEGWSKDSGAGAASSLIDILSPLPVEALRLDPMRVSGLKQMGLKRLGQVLGRERKPLRARFGDVLIARLDQILGLVPEKLVARLPVPERQVERRFADPIGLLDHVMGTVGELAAQMQALLEAEGVKLVWAPKPSEVYPEGYSTNVTVAGVSEGLCGADRPGHFDGVATVVAEGRSLMAMGRGVDVRME
mgnify:CR=1 FL=1